MKRRIPVIVLFLVLLLTAFAIAESIGCPRMGSEGCAMANGSCSMMGSEGCAMASGSCPMMGSEGCAMANDSCPMMGSEGCAMANGSCPMMSSEGCAMANGSCPMMGSEGCTMTNGSCYMMGSHVGCVTTSAALPCNIPQHSLSEAGATPPGYHFLICEDCSQVTGIDYYHCMRSCTVCGLHVHAQETHHDCPIVGLVLC